MKALVFACLLVPTAAFAGDSTHQACVGFATIDHKLEKLAVKYDEQRTGADHRTTTLRMASLGKSYEGTAQSDGNDTFGIKIDTLFDGTVQLLAGEGMLLTGTYNKKAKLIAVLQCTDI